MRHPRDCRRGRRATDERVCTMTEPRRLGDRYELGEVLGYGGMAEVLRGRDIRLGRDVAIKTLRVDLAREPSFQARFRREAQSAAALNHPSIVAVYDTGESMLDGVSVPYIVMEYVEGRTLRDVLKAERHIMPTRALEITAQMLGALEYSHRNGIIHRDIKPGNVMLTPSGDVKVMDFGIARALAQSTATVTQTAAVIGTAQYLSPEQARGEQVDARSDVYSAGCLLYELLTGEPPFTGDSAVAVAYQHVREDPVPPSRLNPDISPATDAIVLKAMAKNPVNRYQSAAEMRDDIERALAGSPVLATPLLTEHTTQLAPVEDVVYRRRQPRGRRSLTYILIALVVIALFVGIGLVLHTMLATKNTVTDGKVPSVVNKTQADAEAALRQAGYNPVVVPGSNGTVAKGTVYDENPSAGTPLPLHSNVSIYVSTGPQSVQVPDLSNKLLADAKTALVASKLKIGKITQQDSNQPSGTVLSQSPAAGTDVASGSPVDVVVASGTTKVPNVQGLPVDQAEQDLTSNGFNFHVTEEPNGQVQPGFVINQSPQHDTPAKLGTTIELYVATAPPSTPASPPSSPAGTPSTSPSTSPTNTATTSATPTKT
jgi:serine/threonine protein kinase